MTPKPAAGDDPGGFKTGGEMNAAADEEVIGEELREMREELRAVRDDLATTREDLEGIRDSDSETADKRDVGGFDIGREP